MKKLLSLVLVLCMVATGCVMFSSCSKVSASDFEKHPSQALGDAVSNTFSNFFEDQVGVLDVLNKIKDKSTVELAFDPKDAFGEDIPLESVNATVYSDMKDREIVLDAEVKYDGKKYSARLYETPVDVAFQSKSILGSDKTLKFGLESFIQKFEDSDIVELADMDDDTVAAIISLAEFLLAQNEKSQKELEEENREMFDNFFLKLGQTVESEKVEDKDGKKTNCVVVTYTITQDTLTDAVTYLLKEVCKDADFMEELSGYDIEEVCDEITDGLEDVDLNVDLKFYVAKKTNAIEKITVNVEIEEVEAEVEMTFTEEQIAFEVDIDKTSIDLTIDKEEVDDGFKYKFSLGAKLASAKVDVLGATLTTKKDGTFELSADIMNFEDTTGDRYEAKLSGKASADKKTATIEFNKVSVKAGEFDKDFKFNLTLKITADADVPAIPEDADDIMDYSKKDWEDLAEKIMDSDLGKLFGGAEAEPAE